MSEAGAEFTTFQGIPDEQKNAITGLAGIRRRSQMLSRELGTLAQSLSSSTALPLKSAYDDQLSLVRNVMSGSAPSESVDGLSTTIGQTASSHLHAASQFQEMAPNLAALHFAKAAFLQQTAESPYGDALEKAKESLKACKKQGIPRTTPADFLPDAYILAIARQAAEGLELPSPQIVAKAVKQDPSLLSDYALVLPEFERDDFLNEFPQEMKVRISLQLDLAVSTVLDRKLTSEPTEIAQRDAVKQRVNQVFQESLEALTSPNDQQSSDGQHLGSRLSSRQIVETIANLGEEDSLRLLRDISEQTIREVKDLNRQLKKRPASERAEALSPALSFTARVLHTLIEADTKRGGVLTMRYLEMSALPDRLFRFFSKKLIDKEYFSKNLSPFLDNENVPILKRLMASYGPQFNTIVDTLAQTEDYKRDYSLVPHKEEIFEALSDLETLTPRIFERHRRLPQEKRKEFAERIRLLKPQFFRNTPIKRILLESDQDILAEMVYMAYKPNQMSFEQVGELIRKVDDHTDDLSSYTFPEEGYPLTLERHGKHTVKERQSVDISLLRRYKNLFTPQPPSLEGEAKPQSFAKAFGLLLAPKTEEQSTRNQDEMLNGLFLPLLAQDRVQDFLTRYSGSVTADTAHPLASELAEITGVYFRDNYSRLLTEYLTANPQEFQQTQQMLTDPNVRITINDRLQWFNEQINWQEFDHVAQTSGRSLLRGVLPSHSSPAELHSLVAGTLTKLIEHEQVEPIRKGLEIELSKFTLSSEDASAYKGELKAYVSKNVGSFFAKAAAGICTAEDISLFERDDHFHINVVENEEIVRANIQAYTPSVEGRPSLILRGFNPTADWVGKIDVGNFCDQILTIGKQFQEENGLAGVYITEQSGVWHALSNRDQVSKYLLGRYVDGKMGTPLSLKVSSGHTIGTIYQV